MLPPMQGDDDHKIDLIGSVPPNKPPCHVSRVQQEEIMSQVQEQQEELMPQGFICPRSSPFWSPILLVQKKDGSYQMCIDYWVLNKNTIKNQFPVPWIEDIFDKL